MNAALLKPKVYVAVLLFACASPALATVTKLSEVYSVIFTQEASSVQMFYTMRDLPDGVTQACSEAFSDHECKIADPNEEYQATDVITKEGLPLRHLFWRASIPGYTILHYEMGGMGHSYHVVVFAEDGQGRIKVVWKGISTEPLKDYSGFLAALKNDTLDDTRDYDF